MPLLLHPHATSPLIRPWIYGRWPVGCNCGAFIVYHASTVASPCHLATDLTLDLWKVACGLQWWSLHSIACLCCCIPMPPCHHSDPGPMEGGLWAAMVEPCRIVCLYGCIPHTTS